MEELYDVRYLKNLAKLYPTVASACTEIINLQSILNLPKGTEHFMTDIHGEYEQFFHVLKNGSGSVRRKIEDVFGNTLSSRDKKSLATLIYYPELKVDLMEKTEENLEDWYRITLHRLISICKRAASKYTRSKVRKALPGDFAYVIDAGFSKAYQKVTGIAGYTLVYNSYGLLLVAHEPFVSVEEALVKETDIHSESRVVERTVRRQRVADTDIGKELQENIRELECLVDAYRTGVITEKM